mgnify:CR=1 FL=1
MSRIGKTPIYIPNSVALETGESQVVVKGPKGTLTVPFDRRISAVVKDGQLVLEIQKGTDIANLHGLTRAIIANAVKGVSEGWEKQIELVGVGYRAQGGGNEISLTVGFSHPVKIIAPIGITFQITDNTKIIISGPDKKTVGEIAAKIRLIKPPEPYKGKGIRYAGEVVRKKAGKAVKAAGTAGA